ncbi:L-galactose dehydrogenase-like [Rhagoletis pomonella]|uniref:L-galactose dehydrogenase-like n=1 Tax=Rhagoletis pomonella TaxID=28610 RepID=UPI0017860DDB|nr:L-galactose dehydrogenase-like [Rhagoletis pomonella]
MSSLPATFVKGIHDEELCKRMEYRTLGRTGLRVSKVAIGTATLSDLYGDLNVDEAIKMIHKAIKSGINYIDTAPYYGQGRAEEVLGMALKDVPRKAYYIATKVARYEKDLVTRFDFSAKRTRESVEKSLKLLGIDYVDVIQIHDIDFAENLDIIVNECLPELEKIVKEGKARFIGITGYTLAVLKECIIRAPGRIDVILSYSRHTLLDDSIKSYVKFFQDHNIGIVCASAHALGLLTNTGPQPWHPCNEELKALCQKAADICKKSNIELGKLAMYHFMQLDGASTFVVGMETRKLLDINLEAYYNGLTLKEQEMLKLLRETIFYQTVQLGWH